MIFNTMLENYFNLRLNLCHFSSMCLHIIMFCVTFLYNIFLANFAWKCLISCMYLHMCCRVTLMSKTFIANFTWKKFLYRMFFSYVLVGETYEKTLLVNFAWKYNFSVCIIQRLIKTRNLFYWIILTLYNVYGTKTFPEPLSSKKLNDYYKIYSHIFIIYNLKGILY